MNDHEAILEKTHVEAILLLAFVFFGFAQVMGHCINVNKFSLHGMYRNRLIRALPWSF